MGVITSIIKRNKIIFLRSNQLDTSAALTYRRLHHSQHDLSSNDCGGQASHDLFLLRRLLILLNSWVGDDDKYFLGIEITNKNCSRIV